MNLKVRFIVNLSKSYSKIIDEAAPYDLMSEGNKVINNGQEEQLNEEHSIHVIKPVDRNEDSKWILNLH